MTTAKKGETPKAATNGVSGEAIQTTKRGNLMSDSNATGASSTSAPSFIKVLPDGAHHRFDWFNTKDEYGETAFVRGLQIIAELAGIVDDDAWQGNTGAVIRTAAAALQDENAYRKEVAQIFFHVLAKAFDVAARQGIVADEIRETAKAEFHFATQEAAANRDAVLAWLPKPNVEPEVKGTKRRAAKTQEATA